MSISSYYGEQPMLSPNRGNDTRYSFNPKEKNEPMPPGVKVLSRSKSISIDEIENGYIVSEYTETKYEYTENDGDVEQRYHSFCRKYYSEKKPFEISLAYD